MPNGWSANPAAFAARSVPVNEPAVVGVPVTAPVGLRERPGGSCPVATEKVGAGKPVAAAWNVTGAPVVRLAGRGPPVTAGDWFTVRVKDRVAAAPTPLTTVTVRG